MVSQPGTFTLLINKKEDAASVQRRQMLTTVPLIMVGLVGVLCLISGASWKSSAPTSMSTQRLYLGSGEENVDGGAVQAAEKVDIGSVNTAMPDVNPMHNPDADEFKQAIAEQDSEMETQKDFMKGKATDPKKSKKTATKQQTLKQSVTAKHQSGKSAKHAK